MVVVTGASRGIGRGVALAFGALGTTVYVTGRTRRAGEGRWPGSVEETAKDVTALGGTGVPVPSDANDEADVASLFERVMRETRGPHILVNTAYAFPPGFDDTPRGIPFWELPQSVWDEAMGTGLRAHYLASRHAVPLMIGIGAGLIINISSDGADDYTFSVPYGVAKQAIERMGRDMAVELAPHGVAVIAFRPGPVLTERLRLTPWNPKAAAMKRRDPLVVGKAIVALAQRADLLELSGGMVRMDG